MAERGNNRTTQKGKTGEVERGKGQSRAKPASKKTRANGGRAKVEISAGGIVFRRTPKGVRVALLLDPFGRWAFAKGHVEKGETIREAALRETREEMSIDKLRIVASLGRIDFWFRDNYRPATRGVLVHKYVNFFLMQAPARAWGRPQKSERIRRIIWVPINRLRAKSSYEDVKPLVEKAVGILTRGSGGAKERGSEGARKI